MAATAQQLDEAKLQAFEEKLIGTLNGGALALMTSIGHRTGLFDTMAKLPAASSADIATSARLNERYVREWLGAMTTAGVVEHDPESGTYALPPEHATLLTRQGSDNVAVFAQYIGQLGAVEDAVVECFHKGGGVPYERYHRFHEIMAEDSGQTVLPALKDHILPLVPELTQRLEQGISVLDVGCGRGKAVNLMAGWFPKSRFVGLDLSEEAIAYAQREAEKQGHENVKFIVRDLSDFDRTAERGAFDFITTFDAVHDQKNPKAVLKGIRISLADDGVYLAQDIKGTSHHHGDRDHPIAPLLYTLSCMHCMTVSLAQGGEGLGAMWGKERALAYFREAGFSDVEVHELEHDFQNYYYVCRP